MASIKCNENTVGGEMANLARDGSAAGTFEVTQAEINIDHSFEITLTVDETED